MGVGNVANVSYGPILLKRIDQGALGLTHDQATGVLLGPRRAAVQPSDRAEVGHDAVAPNKGMLGRVARQVESPLTHPLFVTPPYPLLPEPPRVPRRITV